MVVCVVYWRSLNDVVARVMSCNAPLKASRLLESMFHCAIVRGKKLFLQ